MAIRVKPTKERMAEFTVHPDYNTPSTAYKLFVKADALRLANLFQEAVTKYLNAILIDRDNADSYYGLGICYKNLNKLDKAIDALEKAKKLREMDFNIYYELGVCYLLSGEICCATKNLIKALKLNPKNINAQIQLAIAHEIMEENDMALMIYQKIIETSPKYIKAYNHKSALLMNMEEYYEASVVFNQVLSINPDYYRAYLGIGICFDKMGRKADAVRYYKKFLIRKPNSHHSTYVKNRLETLKPGKRENNLCLVGAN